MIKTSAALLPFAAALALLFVQPGPRLPSLEELNEPFDPVAAANRLAEQGQWTEAFDLLSCAIANAPAGDKDRLSRAWTAVEAELGSQGRPVVRGAPWNRAAALKPEALFSRGAREWVRGTEAEAGDAFVEALSPAKGGSVEPAAVFLICLRRLGAFRDPLAAEIVQRAAGLGPRASETADDSQEGGVPGGAAPGGSVPRPLELALGQIWRGVWSVCRSSGLLGRAASILRHVRDEQDLRLAVIACGLAADSCAKLNAALAAMRAQPDSDDLERECVRWVAQSPAGAVDRLNALYGAACLGPHAVQLALRGVPAADIRSGNPYRGMVLVAWAAGRATQLLGGPGFALVKLGLVLVLTLPIASLLGRRQASSREESGHMAKWIVLAMMVVLAVVIQTAMQPGRPQLSTAAARDMAATAPVGGARGWLSAASLTFVAVLTQVACVAKARQQHRQIMAASGDERSAMRYLQFYAEAPIFIGFLGSVCGAILLQLLSAGHMIYFAYVSTATGMLSFLWIQYRYALDAENKLDSRRGSE